MMTSSIADGLEPSKLSTPPCRRCHAFEDDGSLYLQIQSYLSSLSEELICDETVYNKRLQACDACDKMRAGLCGYCGCFVIVRAKKKGMDCPSPDGSRW